MQTQWMNLAPVIRYVLRRDVLPSAARREHVSVNHDLVYIAEGSITYVIDGEHKLLQRGSVAYIPSGVLKYAYVAPGEPVVAYSILFYYETPAVLPFPFLFGVLPPLEIANDFRDIHETWHEKGDRHSYRAAASLMLLIDRLLTWYGDQHQRYQGPSSHVAKAKHYIKQQGRGKLVVSTLADSIGVHAVYLGSLFKLHTGLTLKEYDRRIRIQRAKDLLSTGEYDIAETAFQCGYDDPLYFSKIFKSETGLSPTTFVHSATKRKS